MARTTYTHASLYRCSCGGHHVTFNDLGDSVECRWCLPSGTGIVINAIRINSVQNRIGFKRTSSGIRQQYNSWKMIHKAMPISTSKIQPVK